MKKRLVTLTLTSLLLISCTNKSQPSTKTTPPTSNLQEKPVEISAETKTGSYKKGRAGYNELKEITKEYLYLANNGSGNKYYPFWLNTLGVNLMRLNEPKEALKPLTKLITLPPETAYANDIKRLETLEKLQEIPKSLHLLALAKLGEKEAFEREKESYTPQNNYSMLYTATAYMLLGEKEKATSYLYKALDPSSFIRLHKRSSTTAGATGMAYAMGKYDDLFTLSQWMVDIGREATDSIHIARGDYGNNQWKSSFDIVMQFRELAQEAQKGKVLSLTHLKDGIYQGVCRGFIDTIAVEIEVSKKKISHITITKSSEDRPFSALEGIPQRIVMAQSLEVDAITEATVTSYAIIAATADAASKAQ